MRKFRRQDGQGLPGGSAAVQTSTSSSGVNGTAGTNVGGTLGTNQGNA
jgi:hypothetical protein